MDKQKTIDQAIFYIALLLGIHGETPQIYIIRQAGDTLVLKVFVSDPVEISNRISPAIRVLQAALLDKSLFLGVQFSLPPKMPIQCLNITHHQLN